MLREGLKNGIMQSPTQDEIATWIVMAQIEMTKKIIIKSWFHSPYNWFEVEELGFKINTMRNAA